MPSAETRRAGSLARRLALLVLILASGAGCGSVAAGARLDDTFATSDDAARAVLEAVWTRDADRLLRLAITEEEFRSVVWPRLPASRPEVGMPLDYLWRDTFGKSRAGVAAALRNHGGRKLQLHAVAFGGHATDYSSFRLHPKTSLVVGDDQGRRLAIRLFGSMIEAGGRWKIFGFVVD